MRIRKQDADGDYVFGSGGMDFLVNTPEAVAQVVQTSLLLWLGEWYLNLNDGVPYPEGVLGKNSKATADATMISQIRKVQGVVSVENFQSTIDPNTRAYKVVSATLNTLYGSTQLQVSTL